VKHKTIVQGLAWAAWIVFIASLFFPTETHTLPLEASQWQCSNRPAYCGWQSTIFFTFSPAILLLNLVQSIPTAILYPEMLGVQLNIVFTMMIYSVIGLGQFTVVLSPLWPFKIKKVSRQKLLLWIIGLSTLSVIVYGLFPDIRQGLDLLSGYYLWALSFVLLFGASILMLSKKDEASFMDRGN